MFSVEKTYRLRRPHPLSWININFFRQSGVHWDWNHLLHFQNLPQIRHNIGDVNKQIIQIPRTRKNIYPNGYINIAPAGNPLFRGFAGQPSINTMFSLPLAILLTAYMNPGTCNAIFQPKWSWFVQWMRPQYSSPPASFHTYRCFKCSSLSASSIGTWEWRRRP